MKPQSILEISVLTLLILALLWPGSIARADSAENVSRKLNDHWQLTINPEEDCSWRNSIYHRGNLAAYRLTGESNYLEEAQLFADDTCRWMLEASSESTEPDAQAAGSVFLDLYHMGGLSNEYLDDLFDSLHRRMDAPVEAPDWIQPGVSAAGNSPDGVPEWTFQDWFYMAGPVLAKAGSLCNSDDPPSQCRQVAYDNNPYWNSLFELYIHMGDNTFVSRNAEEITGQGLYFNVTDSGCEGGSSFDTQDSLVWHDINKKGDCARLWSRGIGWVAAAYVETLDNMCSDSYVKWVEAEPVDLHDLSASANRWQSGNGPENAVDRNPETRWSCENLPESDDCELIVGLEQKQNVDRAFIDFYRGEDRSANFDIYVSEDQQCISDPDSAEWVVRRLDEWSSGDSDSAEEIGVFGVDQVWCIKYVGYGNSENDWNSIEEFDVANTEEMGYYRYNVSERLTEDFSNLASALVKLQRDDGFWNPALMDAVTANTTASEGVESSGTALITYALAKGVRMGILDRETYVPVILRAWDGLQARALRAVGEDGLELTHVQGVAQQPPEQPLSADDAVNADNPERRYAIGAVLLAAAEIADLDSVPIESTVSPAYQAPHSNMNAIDGDLQTRWAADGVGPDFGWIGFNLGELVENIDRIDVAWYRGDERVSYFDLMYSASTSCLNKYNLELEPIPGATGLISSGTTLEMETFRFEPISAVCLGYSGHGNSENTWNSITEFAAYAPVLPLGDSDPIVLDTARVTANRWQEPNVPGNVADGDTTGSRWSCENTEAMENCRLWVDLGETRKLSHVDIYFYKPERYEFFDIETSTEAQCFSEAESIVWEPWDITHSGSFREVETLGMGGREVRCLRYTGLGNSDSSWNSIYELYFYALPGDTEADHAKPSVLSSSAHTEWPNVAENTLDGDLQTRWSCFGVAAPGESESCQVSYDLGAEMSIADIRIAWFRGDVRASRYALDYSADGEYWVPLVSGEHKAATVAARSVSPDPVLARYIRLTGQGNSENAWSSVTEMEIYTH